MIHKDQKHLFISNRLIFDNYIKKYWIFSIKFKKNMISALYNLHLWNLYQIHLINASLLYLFDTVKPNFFVKSWINIKYKIVQCKNDIYWWFVVERIILIIRFKTFWQVFESSLRKSWHITQYTKQQDEAFKVNKNLLILSRMWAQNGGE